ncbi:hypothetical protein LCGC14_2640850 [marine sediment metagenome]|uniref:Uncharacterized protein n=1 Tax=marine sediment metagenome TaxID=412755 RepID=A0A0F8ZXG5_9ZZZZ
MIVRDLTKNKKDYKGHPCHASYSFCPCRPCYNCHDCSPPNPAYTNKVYSDVFSCAYRWSKGCPQPIPEATHDLNRQGRCKQCGEYPNKMGERDGYGRMREIK